MHGQVSMLLETAVKPGELDSFKAVMEEMVEHTRKESGTLNYEWYVSEDGGAVHVFEKYADSEAMIAHGTGLPGDLIKRFISCVEVKRATVYGDPSAPARELMAAFRPTYLGSWGGFAR